MQDLATGINEDHFDAGDVTEEQIENSMAKFKDYFDGKFDNLAKVMELEKQLEENKNKLEQLKARNKLGGNEILEELGSQFTVTQLKRNGEAHLQKTEELI